MTQRRSFWMGRWVSDRDELFSMGAVLGFSLALGTWTLTMPLLALEAGWDAAGIGVLAMLAAVSHLATRLQMAWLLGRVTDRLLLLVACGLLALPYALLLVSQDGWAFVFGQMFNGAARATFWTASQTHVVRGNRAPVRALAQLHVLNSAGQVVGPVAAGALLAAAPAAAVGLGLLAALVGGVACLGLAALPIYARLSGNRLTWWWRSRGVGVAAWASFSAGGWRTLLSSYVPVVLDGAGHNTGLIGLLVGLSDAASIVAAAAVARLDRGALMLTLRFGTIATGAGLAAVGLVPESVAAVGLALGVSGIGAGMISTLGPAIAAESAAGESQGAAIALTGTFRATALLAVPAGVAALLLVVGLSTALVTVGLALTLPGVAASLQRTHSSASVGAQSGPRRD